MKIFKFGGASVKDAKAVKNVGAVIGLFPDQPITVVVSAMGKTTNAFELLLNAWYHNQSLIKECYQEIVDYHNNILRELFPDFNHQVYTAFNQWCSDLEEIIEAPHSDFYDFDYDRIVGRGELLSTKIITYYLNDLDITAEWLDARKLLKTDHTYREAKINWIETESNIKTAVKKEFIIYVTQGFIGSTPEGLSTTLGREGSDYTASIFAYCLDAESVTIWKDVPGVLNADPKWFDETIKLNQISYKEAIELSYYGASIIHPKTIKPLENKSIPLYAKSFVNPEDDGTVIQHNQAYDELVPSFIFKVDQILISITPKDFSFIIEENLEDIFRIFAKRRVKVRLMQNSALNFSVCADMDDQKIPGLIEELQANFKVLYNDTLELVTIRHYDEATIQRVSSNKRILVDQRTRNTVRMVMEDLN